MSTYPRFRVKLLICTSDAFISRRNRPRFMLKVCEDGSFSGSLEQGGLSAAVEMHKLTEEIPQENEKYRPQTPQPPFPYDTREFTVRIQDIVLEGTLTIPDSSIHGAGPYPAAILVWSNGLMDRDNTFAGGHKPFAVISDKLTRQGISVLRLDKRGAGKSSSNGKVHTTIELASDIYAAVALLSNQKEIDPKRIGLIGHSEGATIASMVISDAMEDTSKVKIAFGILLSGEGQPGISCLQDQFSNSLKASGISSEAAEEQMKAYNDMLEAIRQEQSQDIVNKLLREHILKQFSVQNEDELPSESRISFDSALRMSMYQMNDPWMQSYIRTDPQIYLRKVKCPMLILYGENDAVLDPHKNAAHIKAALHEAGNTRVFLDIVPKLNYFFQSSENSTAGDFLDYAQIEETMNPFVLNRMSNWIRNICAIDD